MDILANFKCYYHVLLLLSFSFMCYYGMMVYLIYLGVACWTHSQRVTGLTTSHSSLM